MPAGIVPDEYDGSAWVGLIPFRMRDTAAFGGPPVPYFGSFIEVNVRLYGVDGAGRRGVVFLSLEASRLAAVIAARAVFSLPYFWAATSAARAGDILRYGSQRKTTGRPRSLISARVSESSITDDPLAEFLTARWLLFATRRGRTVAMPNRHEPWPLFDASIVDLRDELIAASGVRSIGTREPDSVLYSPGVTTTFSSPSMVSG